ncbi:MAG: hypothetical protein LH618_01545, partial [Saprospiraceae bacterium]|nr:hypothetical protein [Saprospiraceae bacterium]
ILLTACGGGGKDKNAELASLRDEKSKIEAQISALEKETGATPAAAQRIKTVGLTEVTTAPFKHYIDLQGSGRSG